MSVTVQVCILQVMEQGWDSAGTSTLGEAPDCFALMGPRNKKSWGLKSYCKKKPMQGWERV